MPNIATVLKAEISRISRKEVRSTTEGTQRAVTMYRRQLAEMNRRILLLEREVRSLRKQTGKSKQAAQEAEPATALRFRADGFKAHRERLGLSAKDLGTLLGVSALTVYKWESGKGRPRASYLPAIAQVRAMGKRKALKRLDELSS